MRPRLQSSACVRPLSFTVRRRCCSVRTSAVVVTTVAFAALGPPVGTVVVWIGGLLFSIAKGHGVGNMLVGLVFFLSVFQPFAFSIGEVPALASGAVIALAAKGYPTLFLGRVWKRAVFSGLVGALATAIWDLLVHRHIRIHQSPALIASNVLFDFAVGGVSAAVLGSFLPLRAWVVAPSNHRWSGP
jgi:hypothetical protein